MSAGEVLCPKCNGTGYLPKCAHVDHGKCFGCMGTGYLNRSWKKREAELLAWVAEITNIEATALIEEEVATCLRKKFITQDNADAVLRLINERKRSLPTKVEIEQRKCEARRKRMDECRTRGSDNAVQSQASR